MISAKISTHGQLPELRKFAILISRVPGLAQKTIRYILGGLKWQA